MVPNFLCRHPMGHLFIMQRYLDLSPSHGMSISKKEAWNSAYLTCSPWDPYAKLENLCLLGMWARGWFELGGSFFPTSHRRLAPSWQLPMLCPPASFPLTSVVSCSPLSSQMFSNKRSFFRIHASWRPRYPLACSSCPASPCPTQFWGWRGRQDGPEWWAS